MVKIKNLSTGEVYTMNCASNKYATNDSVIIDRVVGSNFRMKWSRVVLFFNYGSSHTELILKDGFEVIK